MPNTRSSNSKANFKAYYSKKAAPYQQYFPHKRKVVRRPDAHDDDGKKQMKFLPEMMKRRGTVQDSDEEESELFEEEEDELEVQSKRGSKKRNSGVMRGGIKEEEEDEEPIRPTPKRRRKSADHDDTARLTRRRRRPAPVEPAPGESDDTETEEEEAPKPRLRRQSTMTQIVDGRSPAPGSPEPEFKPVKRAARTSWGGKGSKSGVKKDAKQRTLTQMVHTMTPLVLDSDEEPEIETDEEADAAHHSFIFGDSSKTTLSGDVDGDQENQPPVEDSLPVATSGDSSEDEYQPTQFIDAPVTKTRRTPLRASTRRQATPVIKKELRSSAQKSPKSRFGLLSTPEKRGVREIQSSQSPPITPLSTQATPRRSGRTPLQPRSTNKTKIAQIFPKGVAETPSKRKQVTFHDGTQEQIPPPTLRKFASTIPDSEEDAGFSDSDGQSDSGDEIGEKTQALLRNADSPGSGVDVGAETQAMLLDIDRACASADEDIARANRKGSEELGEQPSHQRGEGSQEFGDPRERNEDSTIAGNQSTETPELPPLPFSSPQLRNNVAVNTESNTETETSPPVVQALPSSPPIEDFRTQPSTPMFDEDETSEDVEEEDDPTIIAATSQSPSPRKPRRSSPIPDFRTQSLAPMFDDDNDNDDNNDDEDDSPETFPPPLATGSTATHSILVPRSPAPRIKTEPSHSSQAELQLHSESYHYSQYHRRAPMPSSMQVAHDSNYSYQATPRPGPPQAQFASNTLASQATTVDPTQFSVRATPRKQRGRGPMFTSPAARTPKSGQRQAQERERERSPHPMPKSRKGKDAITTPKSSRHFPAQPRSPDGSSPPGSRPAPLVIPSSFPSPARVTMEGWSSPVLERGEESQWGMGSLEDFSIPGLPPGSSQWVGDEED